MSTIQELGAFLSREAAAVTPAATVEATTLNSSYSGTGGLAAQP